MVNEDTNMFEPAKAGRDSNAGDAPQRSAGPRRRATTGGDTHADPLTPDQASSLLTRVGVVRDPLHGDISLTKLERTIVDTPAFQRLKQINQLAMVEPVYPGALHNRFLHSLGVLHVCSEMITACNNSAKAFRRLATSEHPIPVRIGPYAELLARLVALMHDMAHIPFGHVLEREAQVIPEEKDEWKDPWRVEQVFGPKSDFVQAFSECVVDHFSNAAAPASERLSPPDATRAAHGVLTEIRAVLTADKSDKKDTARNLPYPFVYDLVSNTICADLIDYIQRDMFFCGLTEGIGTRFMRQLGVIPTEFDASPAEGGESNLTPCRLADSIEYAERAQSTGNRVRAARLVLFLYTYNERRVVSGKDNVLGEAIDLVRRRKQLAEKVYFHKTKLVATAMLAAAAHGSGLTAQTVWNMSDRELLKWLATPDEGADRTRRRSATLANKVMARRLFKRLFRFSFHPQSDDFISTLLWDPKTGAYERLYKPAKRAELIDKLEEIISLSLDDANKALGSVAISCPNKKMQLKGFDMLVLHTPGNAALEPLQKTVRPVIKKEIETIQEGHRELWKLEVLVDPDVVVLGSPLAKRLVAAIVHAIGLPNELPEYKGISPEDPDEILRTAVVDAELRKANATDRITHSQYEELRGELVARDVKESPAARIRKRLQEWGLGANGPAGQ